MRRRLITPDVLANMSVYQDDEGEWWWHAVVSRLWGGMLQCVTLQGCWSGSEAASRATAERVINNHGAAIMAGAARDLSAALTRVGP